MLATSSVVEPCLRALVPPQQASDGPILGVRLDLSEKLQDPINVLFRLLGMRPDLGPARIGNQTMHLLSHPTGVDVVVARHQQGRRPQPP